MISNLWTQLKVNTLKDTYLSFLSYITLPPIPILEKASESPLNILDLIRGKVLRNKVDDDHRLFLQRYPAIQIMKLLHLKRMMFT